MTDLQNKMLIEIAHSDYSPTNSVPPKDFSETGEIWLNCVVNTPKEKGVLTSLINAGMVVTFVGASKQDNTVSLTEAGFAAYLETQK
jgi:hypothetical protein